MKSLRFVKFDEEENEFMQTAPLLCATLAATFFSAGSTGRSDKGIVCSLAKLVDSERSNMPAYTFLTPAGWTTQNKLQWNNDVPQVELLGKTADQTYLVDRIEPFNLFYGAADGNGPNRT